MPKKKKFLVIAYQTTMVRYIVEATSFKQAENKVYEGADDVEPLEFYNEEVEVRDVFEWVK